MPVDSCWPLQPSPETRRAASPPTVEAPTWTVSGPLFCTQMEAFCSPCSTRTIPKSWADGCAVSGEGTGPGGGAAPAEPAAGASSANADKTAGASIRRNECDMAGSFRL